MSNKQVMELAFGRILRMATRTTQDGDIAEYERCRMLFLEAAEAEGLSSEITSIGVHRPGWNFGNMVLE